MQVILFKSGSRSKYLRYGLQLVGSRVGIPPRQIPGIEITRADELVCLDLPAADGNDEPLLAETDGELLGKLPVRLSIATQPITVLAPNSLPA